ncbi:MAG: hypothetical protein GY722_27160 [bacterium]|nr:hypothetical protein [bacterium]
MSEKRMSFPKRLALLTFLLAMLGLSGVVTNRHLDPPRWGSVEEEMILALFWAAGLAAGTFALCWSCGVLFEMVGLLPVPIAARESQVERRILALSLLLVIALTAAWLLPGEIQRRRAEDSQATPEELRGIYAEATTRDYTEVLAAVAAHRNTPSDVLLDLAVAQNPDLDRPRRNLVALLQGPHRSVRQLVAARPVTPPDGLSHLGESGPLNVLEVLAWNPGTPPATLLRLADNPSLEVLRALAHNPGTPAEVLELLAAHPDKSVRAGVASRGDTPPSLLSRLATDPSTKVRHCVATNPQISLETLDLLLADPDEETRRLAREAPGREAWPRR